MNVLVLILTVLFTDGSILTKVYQAPKGETMEHCKAVVLPGAIKKTNERVLGVVQTTGICYHIEINLQKV